MSSQPVTVMCSACDILPSSVTSRDNPRQTTTRRVRVVRRGDNSQWRDVTVRCDADDGYSCSDLPPPLPPGGCSNRCAVLRALRAELPAAALTPTPSASTSPLTSTARGTGWVQRPLSARARALRGRTSGHRVQATPSCASLGDGLPLLCYK